MTLSPLKNPCASCPYRKDVPSGVWAAEEYLKLPLYDRETQDQPIAVFQCHQRNGHACSGWVAVHDMQNNFAIRVAALMGHIDDMDAFLDYETDVPLHESGMDACVHGLRDVMDPSEDADKVMAKIRKVHDARE